MTNPTSDAEPDEPSPADATPPSETDPPTSPGFAPPPPPPDGPEGAPQGPTGAAGPLPPPPPPAPAGLSVGAARGIGATAGCLAHFLGFALMMATLSAAAWMGLFAMVWPYVLILLVSALLLIRPSTRPYAVGALIVAAASWIVLIGPCLLLFSGQNF
ncbi:hypothetical protein [Microbacterium resistens]